jgi:hypothetical protein
MADEADEANENRDKEEARRIQAARDQAARIPVGNAGDCDLCGEWSGRLVGGACARCRDKWRLP